LRWSRLRPPLGLRTDMLQPHHQLVALGTGARARWHCCARCRALRCRRSRSAPGPASQTAALPGRSLCCRRPCLCRPGGEGPPAPWTGRAWGPPGPPCEQPLGCCRALAPGLSATAILLQRGSSLLLCVLNCRLATSFLAERAWYGLGVLDLQREGVPISLIRAPKTWRCALASHSLMLPTFILTRKTCLAAGLPIVGVPRPPHHTTPRPASGKPRDESYEVVTVCCLMFTVGGLQILWSVNVRSN
jgi:hypothetical protein